MCISLRVDFYKEKGVAAHKVARETNVGVVFMAAVDLCMVRREAGT